MDSELVAMSPRRTSTRGRKVRLDWQEQDRYRKAQFGDQSRPQNGAGPLTSLDKQQELHLPLLQLLLQPQLQPQLQPLQHNNLKQGRRD